MKFHISTKLGGREFESHPKHVVVRSTICFEDALHTLVSVYVYTLCIVLTSSE